MEFKTLEQIEKDKKSAISKANRQYKQDKIQLILNYVELAEFGHIRCLFFSMIKRFTKQYIETVDNEEINSNLNLKEQTKLIKDILTTDNDLNNGIRLAKSLIKIKEHYLLSVGFYNTLTKVQQQNIINAHNKINKKDKIIHWKTLQSKVSQEIIIKEYFNQIDIIQIFNYLKKLDNFIFEENTQFQHYISNAHWTTLLQMNKIKDF